MMKESSKEKILMAKSMKEVDGPWEMIAFLYTWRRRELWQTLFIISLFSNIYFVMRYTNAIQYFINYMSR